MTEELSRAFEELCRLSLKDPSDTIVVIPRVGSAPLSGQPLEPYGPKYGMLLELQAAGLIMSMTQATWNLKENDPEAVIEYAGQRAILRARESKSLGLHDGIFISVAGGELRSLIALAPVPEYTAAFADYLDKLDLDSLDVLPDGSLRVDALVCKLICEAVPRKYNICTFGDCERTTMSELCEAHRAGS